MDTILTTITFLVDGSLRTWQATIPWQLDTDAAGEIMHSAFLVYLTHAYPGRKVEVVEIHSELLSANLI